MALGRARLTGDTPKVVGKPWVGGVDRAVWNWMRKQGESVNGLATELRTIFSTPAGALQGILTTVGDLLGFDGTPVRIPVGTPGQVLTANPLVGPGIDWEDVPGVIADLYRGCVSSWRLDEATGLVRKDSIGRERFNDLTPTNAPTQVGGKIGNAAQFVTASAMSLIIPDAVQSGLNPHLGDFSLSLWIYPDALPAGSGYAIDKGCYANASPEQIGYAIGLLGSGSAHPGCVVVLFGAPPSTSIGGYFVSSTVPPIGAWTHLLWAIDRDGQMALYVNGVYNGTILDGSLVTASLDNTGDATSAAPFLIGAGSATFSPTVANSAYFNGRVDAVGYFNFTLGAAHAAALYNGGLGRELFPLWSTRFDDVQNIIAQQSFGRH